MQPTRAEHPEGGEASGVVVAAQEVGETAEHPEAGEAGGVVVAPHEVGGACERERAGLLGERVHRRVQRRHGRRAGRHVRRLHKSPNMARVQTLPESKHCKIPIIPRSSALPKNGVPTRPPTRPNSFLRGPTQIGEYGRAGPPPSPGG
eukprot:1196049-Prorocentrum_minimum.AAC.3